MRSKKFNLAIYAVSILLLFGSLSLVGCAEKSSTSVTSSPVSTTVQSVTSTNSSTTPASKGYVQESDQQYKYKFEYPENWGVSVMDQGELTVLLVTRCIVKSETFTNEQDGTSIKFDVKLANCYCAADQEIGYLPSSVISVDLYYFTILEHKNILVHGLTADNIIYAAPPLDTYRKYSEVTIQSGDLKYVITYSASSDQLFDSSHHFFDDFLNSFNTQ